MAIETRKKLAELGRYKDRGSYDFDTISAIVDAGLICHVGITHLQQPVVLPTIYGRIDRSLYIHGSTLARWMKGLAESIPVCVTISILDGIVFARSAFNHSLNYRSVVSFAEASLVTNSTEKLTALKSIVEHVCPGRWGDVRGPSRHELEATMVLRVPLDVASAKVRSGPPDDPAGDLGNGYWAGVLAIASVYAETLPDPKLEDGIQVPQYIRDLTTRPLAKQ